MAGTAVYQSFEVREGFGPTDLGPLLFESEQRADADTVLEELSIEGSGVQLFGIRSDEHGERVLLRVLVGQQAA